MGDPAMKEKTMNKWVKAIQILSTTLALLITILYWDELRSITVSHIVDASPTTWIFAILIVLVYYVLKSFIMIVPVLIIQIAVPILLIIFGMIDFAKSVVAKSEDDVKKYRKNFTSRLVSAIVVFLIVWIVQFAVSLVSTVEDRTDESGHTISDIWSCSKKFIIGVDNNASSNNN